MRVVLNKSWGGVGGVGFGLFGRGVGSREKCACGKLMMKVRAKKIKSVIKGDGDKGKVCEPQIVIFKK